MDEVKVDPKARACACWVLLIGSIIFWGGLLGLSIWVWTGHF